MCVEVKSIFLETCKMLHEQYTSNGSHHTKFDGQSSMKCLSICLATCSEIELLGTRARQSRIPAELK